MTSSCPQDGEWVTVKASSRKGKSQQKSFKPALYKKSTDEIQSLYDPYHSHKTTRRRRDDSDTKEDKNKEDTVIINSVYEKIIQTIMSIIDYQKWKPKTAAAAAAAAGDENKLFNVQRIIHTIQMITSQPSHCSHEDDNNCHTTKDISSSSSSAARNHRIHEIVCYGIGNFYSASSSSSSSSSILQLAFILLLRHALIANTTTYNGTVVLEKENSILSFDRNDVINDNKECCTTTTTTMNDTISSALFEQDQKQVKLLYYDPLMHPIEKRILMEYLHVEIISQNEKGKRRINTSPWDNTTLSTSSTLFFMPHCPMKLYSNVLWMNWYDLNYGKIIFIGNSFHAYDQRILDSKIRQDSTNGIFPLLPYVIEESILQKGNKGNISKRRNYHGIVQEDDMYHEIEDEFEKAFQDCSILYFHIQKDKQKNRDKKEEEKDTSWEYPKRPDEYNGTEEGYPDEIL